MIQPEDFLTTKQAAALLHRSCQRLREWAIMKNPPLKPRRIAGFGSRLLWSRAEIEALLLGKTSVNENAGR